MEDVLEVYRRPYDEARPVVCVDEATKQLVADVTPPVPMQPSQPLRQDYEYERRGTANLFMVSEPLAGQRQVKVTDRRTKNDFAQLLAEISDVHYPDAEKIVLVMDNLNTHKLSVLYAIFPPAEARRLWERFEVHHTPKHASWLNMAECELSVLGRQCLDQRVARRDPHPTGTAAAPQPDPAEHGDVVVGLDGRLTTRAPRSGRHQRLAARQAVDASA